ncbi:hypothetical protein [Enterococcus lactis]|uniref:hypothetical protein n=1 Tax=Enterococcus lactis TaxID=357441 RepID=UPI0034E9553D
MAYKDSQVTYKELAQLTLKVGKHCLKKEEGKEYIRKTKLTSDGHNDKIYKQFQTVLLSLWNGNSFFDKFYKVQNFFPYAIPIVLDNEPPRM